MISVVSPTAVDNTILYVPGILVGVLTVTVESLMTTMLLAVVEPKWTAVVPVRLLPDKVTVSPPAALPCVGVTEFKIGSGWKV